MSDIDFEVDRKIYLDHHNARIAEYGQNVRAVSWGSTESQQARFRIISEIGELNNRSILDVGCGFGDLYAFLRQQDICPKLYVGIDINQKMIATARSRFPKATFQVGDILDSKLTEKFNYVVSSGIFGLETPNWQAVTEKILSRMYELCEIGVAVNFLSSFTLGKKVADSHYANPADILDFVCKNLSTRIILRHDYRPNDFTLYIYKPFERKL